MRVFSTNPEVVRLQYGGTSLALLVASLVLLPLGVSTSATPQIRVSAPTIVRQASAYVAAYQRAFAFLIADEDSVQHAMLGGANEKEAELAYDRSHRPRQRTTRGELFLTYLGADRRWIALHDVIEVDGTPVNDRQDLRALLAVSSTQLVAARLFSHNARYNIGSITRTFNEPTLALLVLEERNAPRFRFTLGPVDRTMPGVTLLSLDFRERDRPTMVRGLDGEQVFSNGTLVIEAETGVIRRTTLTLRHGSIDAELTTTFERDDRLELWLPSLFTERYQSGPRDNLPAEAITGEARYTNYRRFEATSRLASPQ